MQPWHLQQKGTDIYGNKCIGCRSRCKFFAGEDKMWFPRNETLWPIAFASKNQTNAENHYSNKERETLGMLHGLGKFHQFCFAWEVHVITDH